MLRYENQYSSSLDTDSRDHTIPIPSIPTPINTSILRDHRCHQYQYLEYQFFQSIPDTQHQDSIPVLVLVHVYGQLRKMDVASMSNTSLTHRLNITDAEIMDYLDDFEEMIDGQKHSKRNQIVAICHRDSFSCQIDEVDPHLI